MFARKCFLFVNGGRNSLQVHKATAAPYLYEGFLEEIGVVVGGGGGGGSNPLPVSLWDLLSVEM